MSDARQAERQWWGRCEHFVPVLKVVVSLYGTLWLRLLPGCSPEDQQIVFLLVLGIGLGCTPRDRLFYRQRNLRRESEHAERSPDPGR